MARAAQNAIDRYRARRLGLPTAPAPDTAPAPRRHRLLAVALLGAAAAVATALLLTRPPAPLEMAYAIDLSEAPRGSLTLTLELSGDLPRRLDLAFPPGAGGNPPPGVRPHTPSAHAIAPDGRPGRPLALERDGDAWRLHPRGAERAAVVYRVDLARPDGTDQDIRRHISTLVNGGLRAAGFEIFLVPRGAPVADITVSLHNPRDLEVLAPWPALVQRPAPRPSRADSTARAHLGDGQGYRPADLDPVRETRAATPSPAARPTVHDLTYHPRDLADLNNALLVCGDLRTAAVAARDCVIQFATDRRWLFDDAEALDLVRRIARTQLGFFGSAPSPTITVLLAANEVRADEAFDVYGVHTGSSVLVMIDPRTTWGELEDHAASVIAHEMFHGWLGEAIPQEDPATLWFTEGATTWYAARMLTAAGVWSPAHARQVLGARLERDYARSELLGTTPVATAAAEVMADPAQVRFAYAGGVAVCAALDAWLTRHGGRERPLDAVLRHLYDRRDGRPLDRARLEAAVLAVTGVDCAEWLDRHAYGKTALPLPDDLI